MGGLQRAGAGVVCLLAVVLVLRVQERERLTDERDLAQVRYESGLLEKQLAFAQLEATESRARHERDMRQAAIEAAAELSAQSRAAVEAVEAPAAEAPAAAPSPAKVTMRASIRLPESRGGGKMLVKLTRSGDGLRIQFLDTNMDSHHSQIIDEADLPDGLTDVMTRAHAEYLAEKFYVDCR